MGKMKLGLIVGLSAEPEAAFEKVARMGVPTCQLAATAEEALAGVDPKAVARAAENAGVEITSLFLLFEGQVFDRKNGPATMGLVAPDHRRRRVELARRFSDFTAEMGVPSITCHVGFIPNDPSTDLYKGFIEAQRQVAEHCKANGQLFCFETGQELPSTLRRTIEDVGTGNLGVNLDPANLILYGMANPLDAVEILGTYVKGMHAKDGLPPNRDEALGVEVPLGEGEVDFPLLMRRLVQSGFRGPVTIEREITGPEQERDIRRAMEILDPLLEIPE